MRARGWLIFAAAVIETACRGPAGQGNAHPLDAASSSPTGSEPTAAPAPTRTGTTPAPPLPSPSPSADASTLALLHDSGAPACRVLRGPIELPLRTPAATALRGDTLEVVLNDDGKPHTVAFDAGPLPSAAVVAPPREAAEGGSAPGYAVACGLAAGRVYCADRTGAVHRTERDGSDDRVVASSRTGSRIAAATLGGKHAALAYLASRKTSEGWVSEAWLAVDDDAPVRVSEDGSGATAVTLATRGASILAVSVDARTALTALHVRPVTFDGHTALGEDVVVFVGGPAERHSMPAVAQPATGPGWALLPIAKDAASFGVAHVRIEDPPRVDEPVVWSMYPNGLDPAPLAAAVRGDTTWTARVRPEGPEPGSARVLELGVVAADGSFTPRHLLSTAGKPTAVGLTADAHGGLWIGWVDGGGSWLERVACR